MTHSMTAFSRAQTNTDQGQLVWELRSVNHRYLDLSFRIPEELRAIETQVREQIRKKLKRGKIELSLKYNHDENRAIAAEINPTATKDLLNTIANLAELAPDLPKPDLSLILNWPGILQSPSIDFDDLKSTATALFTTALEQLILARKHEGSSLKQIVLEKNSSLENHLNEIEKHTPAIREQQRDKLLKRIAELAINVDQERLEQELLFLCQKSDITEEIDRLRTHSQELSKIFTTSESIGRRLDFLMQEMNREANTIGSKISDKHITHHVVELKVLIEQIREQIQNIE